MASPVVKRKKSCDDDDNDASQLSDSNGVATKTSTPLSKSLELISSAIIDEASDKASTFVKSSDCSNSDGEPSSNGTDGPESGVKDDDKNDVDANESIQGSDNDVEKTTMKEGSNDDIGTDCENDDHEDATSILERKHGYRFNAMGQLRHITTGAEFKFDVFGERAKNQRRYEEIGDLLNLVVYGLLETSVNLCRIAIPLDAADDESTGFVFASPDFETNPRLLVLIHGSGVVRAGQWARRLLINDSLDSGTQLPFVRQAQSMGFAILVLNTNQNSVPVKEKKRRPGSKSPSIPIRGSESPRAHGLYIWENVVMKNQHFSEIIVVAHSFGGVVTTEIASEFPDFWYSRVKALAFTDSVHGERAFTVDRRLASWFAGNAVNWVTSDEEIDTPLRRSTTVPCVSAGHTSHENTSWSAFKSIFQFFKKKLEKSSG